MPKIQKDKSIPKCASCKTYFEPDVKKNGDFYKCCFKCRTRTVYYNSRLPLVGNPNLSSNPPQPQLSNHQPS